MRAVLILAFAVGCSTDALGTFVEDMAQNPDLSTATDLAPPAELAGGADLTMATGEDLAASVISDMATALRDLSHPDLAPRPDLAPARDMTPLPDLAPACQPVLLQQSCAVANPCCQDGVACTMVDGTARCCQPLGSSCTGIADCCMPSGITGIACYNSSCCAISYITTGCPAGKRKTCAECPAGVVNCSATCT